MQLSNKLLWALSDHAKMRLGSLADSCLEFDLEALEKDRNSEDLFDRLYPITVRINKETGAIEDSR